MVLSIGFIHILHGECILMKQDVVVVQTSKCKCETYIARNNTFEEC